MSVRHNVFTPHRNQAQKNQFNRKGLSAGLIYGGLTPLNIAELKRRNRLRGSDAIMFHAHSWSIDQTDLLRSVQ
jgi:hypothetical protein